MIQKIRSIRLDPRSKMEIGSLNNAEKAPKLIEGEDYYFEDGLMVLTAKFLLDRGYCCGNGCRHCPYHGEDARGQSKNSSNSL